MPARPDSVALVLASASPQRAAILAQLGVPCTVVPAEVAELADGEPAAVAAENARRKALAVPGAVVLGADTVVSVDGAPLGKPPDAAAARAFLARLQGRAHEVLGGIAIARAGALQWCAVARTGVRMRTLCADAIEAYVACGEWEGRAGGYAIQGRGAALVESIEGDYSNVVGLPVALLAAREPGLLGLP